MYLAKGVFRKGRIFQKFTGPIFPWIGIRIGNIIFKDILGKEFYSTFFALF